MLTNPSPLLALPGAVPATGADAGVAAHYGNPMAEQGLLAAGKALVDLSHRSVLAIAGPDRLTWLDSLTSQSVADLAPGESRETLLLDPAGHIEQVIFLVDDGTTSWLLTEAAAGAGLLEWLSRMRFLLRVELADRTDEFAVVGSFGSPDLPVAAPDGVPLVWRDGWASVQPGGVQYAANPHPASSWTWREMLIPRARFGELTALIQAGAVAAAGTLALAALRIAAWRPRAAAEVDAKSIPHELDWLRSAVHLSKGCYRGQETVAKVHNLGHPPRRLVLLHLDGSDSIPVSAGDAVELRRGDERTSVGRVTSAAMHHELGPIALAVVKRGIDPAAPLVVVSGGSVVAAAQEVIVPVTAGASAAVPRLPRLGAVRR